MERQPIGRRLFEDFCRQREFYRNWMNFLELVNQYELSINDKHKIADEIRKKFLAQDAPCRLNSTRPGYFHKNKMLEKYNITGWIKNLVQIPLTRFQSDVSYSFADWLLGPGSSVLSLIG